MLKNLSKIEEKTLFNFLWDTRSDTSYFIFVTFYFLTATNHKFSESWIFPFPFFYNNEFYCITTYIYFMYAILVVMMLGSKSRVQVGYNFSGWVWVTTIFRLLFGNCYPWATSGFDSMTVLNVEVCPN